MAWLWRRNSIRAGLLVATALAGWPDAFAGEPNLSNLSLEELGNIQVTSVSKTSEPLSDAPAAIAVITHDDVIRSGAASMPEILRLAPNLAVAQITSNDFAISARGFNSAAASKLLVLVDGRSVYTPFFNGVAWDVQDMPPEDIERIEVVSGPGGTLWGANAVNGVINIVTRRASETQGGVIDLRAGNLERGASIQYGGKLGPDTHYRVYADGIDKAHDITARGAGAEDPWHKEQGGFRLDWTPEDDLLTVQGDFYQGAEKQLSADALKIEGRNLLVRWTHPTGDDSSLQVQAYYDYVARILPSLSYYLDTYDGQVQHSFSWGANQKIVWGGGYRVMKDDFPFRPSPVGYFFFVPQGRTLTLANLFAEDSIALGSDMTLIAGLRLEDEPYVGLTPLPSLRLSWKATERDLLWAAVSRAARAPSRVDRDLSQTVGRQLVITGDGFRSETLTAYELGYRAAFPAGASLSISSYYNVYKDLRNVELSPGGKLPFTFGNGMEGDTYGVEAWGAYRVNTWWRLVAGADWFHKNLRFKPGSGTFGGLQIAGDDPGYQASLRSTMNLGPDVVLEADLRRIGSLRYPPSPAYTELNSRIGWAVSQSVELSLIGSNLLHPHHLEFGKTPNTLQIGSSGLETSRSVEGLVRLRF